MKNLKKLLLLLFIVPFAFSFVSCKDKSDGDENSTDPSTPNQEVTVETFSVSYDYNLPEKYDFILKNFTDSNNDIGSSVDLVEIVDDNLAEHFLGWYDADDELVSGSITSSTATTISLTAKWNTENIDKFYYTPGLTFEVEGGKAWVSGFSSTASKIVLPKVYVSETIEYPVTKIKESVFENKNIQGVVINAENVSIGDSAFKNTKLTEFDFSRVEQIGNSAFETTKLSEIVLFSGLESLGESAFRDCKNLTKIDFSNAEIDIQNEAFSACDNLTEIKNAKNILTIGEKAFAECRRLQNTSFLNDSTKLTLIGNNAFLNCVNIVSAKIPESVLEIYVPFEGCSNVSEIIISRTYVEFFNGSDNLLNHIGNIGSSVKKVIFEGNSVSRIIENYFDGFVELESFVMCDSITHIEKFAFRQCSKLSNVVFSNNIDLDDFTYLAFYNTKYLNDMNEPLIYNNSILYVPQNIVSEYSIPNGVTKINPQAFAYRENLTKVTIPSTVEEISYSAFEGCKNLTTVVFSENPNITKIDTLTFAFCEKLNNVNLVNLTNLTELGIESFKDTGFTKFMLPASVVEIKTGALAGIDLSEFEVIGTGGIFTSIDGVLYKDVSAAGDGSELMLLSYPKNKVDNLFVCPENVVEIASYAFAYASHLRYVYFANSSMEWETSTNAFGETIYSSFAGIGGINILREQTTLTTAESCVIFYDMITSGCSWNFDDKVIEFEDEFTTDYTYCFIKFLDGDKFSVAVFEYAVVDGKPTVVDDSLVLLEKILNE